MRNIFLPIIILAVFIISCDGNGEKELRATVDSFSVAYFNWDFKRAVPYTDRHSVRWLEYAASQVTQEDVDSLRSSDQGAKVKLRDVRFGDDDNKAVVLVDVSHYLPLDSIGRPPHFINNVSTYRIYATRDNGKWKILLNGLPRQ